MRMVNTMTRQLPLPLNTRKSRFEREPGKTRCQQSIEIDFAEKATLIRLSKKRKISVAELIRTYIAWGIETDSK